MLHDIQVIPNLFIMFGKLFELITIIRLIIYTCLDEANPDFGVCKRQRHMPACISAQSDQHIFYLRICKYILVCFLANFNILTSH